jgi:tetratricopeptide (TPR) repeat protein
VSHAAISDHRIPRRPEAAGMSAAPPTGPRLAEAAVVRFHRDLPGTGEPDLGRDQALALLKLAEPREPRAGKEPLAAAALPLLDEALRSWPDDTVAWEGRGFALWLLDRNAEALAAYERALALAPEREVSLVDAALVAEALGQPEKARGYWERALAVNPWLSRYRFHYANLLIQGQKWSEALQQCHTVLRDHPDNVEVRLLVIACEARLGNPERARAEFDKVLALSPPDPEALRRWFAMLMH